MKKIITTNTAPEAVGPYSQAVESGNTLYVSGQIPINPANDKMVEKNIKAQTIRVLENLKNIIEAAGYNMEDVVKCTCLLINMDDFKSFNVIYSTYFKENPPARATFQVAALPMGALVEVDAIVCK